MRLQERPVAAGGLFLGLLPNQRVPRLRVHLSTSPPFQNSLSSWQLFRDATADQYIPLVPSCLVSRMPSAFIPQSLLPPLDRKERGVRLTAEMWDCAILCYEKRRYTLVELLSNISMVPWHVPE
jgi:hypothetical protein